MTLPNFDFLLGLPSDPEAAGLFLGLPDPDFRVVDVNDADDVASPISCFGIETKAEEVGVGGEVRTPNRNSRTSSMMHLINK